MPEKIPLSRVYQSETIDRRILQVVKGGNYILGPECKAFESELAAYFGVKHAVLSSSWTAAMHLLHIAQDLKAGDEILVPSLTAFPSIEPMIHAGAKPVFCDIDETYTLDLNDARKKITDRTVGILPVHLYGRPADIDGVMKLAHEHKLWVVEDCAQSHGAKWKGRRAGSFGNHAAISFYPSKNLTVYGDGGAILTNDSQMAEQVTMLRNHGRKDKYLHEKIGFNLRFNEIQAAVGREQLKVLDELNAGRRRVAEWYRRELAGVADVALPPVDSANTESVYHIFAIRLNNHDVREALARYLKERGIETGVHYPVPNHQQPAITDFFGKQPTLPRTEDYVKRILSLPMFPAMTEPQVVTVAAAIKGFLGEKVNRMSELLLIYTSIAVFRMPYQDNYWLWKAVGFAGIGTFGTRFLIQWLYSEKHKESRIPVIFWWQSLLGTMLCLLYFLRQQDSVGIAGYVLNVIPYSRNLILVYRKRREETEKGFPVETK